MGVMNFLTLIEGKREGQRLATEQIRAFIGEFTAGSIPDYQMAAFLMAVYFRGLDGAETSALTLAMRDSGDVLKFPKDRRPLVDKHSTGGIGDKVSLPLAPLLACLGFRVPMISGRGLGITGGTLDKLDAIPGFETRLPVEHIVRQVQEIGCVMCGQTERMVPADKKMYALRDASGTVPSIPLITASILSKKLAESLEALVLDVKFGTAAFMSTPGEARRLARAMVALGRACGVNTRAILTDMNTPLGRAAGNWLEVKESVACLEGRGPADLHELVVLFAAQLVLQTGRAKNLRAAQTTVRDCLASGAPRRKWEEMLAAQGANLEAYRQKLAGENTAPVCVDLKASRAGYVTRCDARIIGEVIRELGGGRLTRDAAIDHEVGVDQIAKPGERVKRQAVLARIHAATTAQAQAALEQIKAAFAISARPAKAQRLVAETIV
jgi:pyrimidine-nucleoside phosphorylase